MNYKEKTFAYGAEIMLCGVLVIFTMLDIIPLALCIALILLSFVSIAMIIRNENEDEL